MVSLTCAADNSEVSVALTFDYGQRSARKEIEAARECCRCVGAPHRVVPLDWLAEITKTALVNRSVQIPHVEERDLREAAAGPTEATSQVWVPNRNGLFINIAAAFAESSAASLIVTGFNREEGNSFPDNSPHFVEAANRALETSTLRRIRVISYTQDLTKAEIVRLGIEVGAPLHSLYSCYVGDERMCGRCESCVRLRRAFTSTGHWEMIRDKFVC